MWIIGVGQLVYEVDLFKLGIYILITFLVLGYIALSTILAMCQHGDQAWNLWHIIAEGVK